MTPPTPDLSIIIVNWNTRQLLLDCLRSLETPPPQHQLEVIVVDNASRDDSVVAVRAAFPAVRVIENAANRGFAAANNQAIAQSSGRYVLLLNSDTVVTPGALDGLVAFADAHPDVGVVGAQLLNGDGTLQPSWAAYPNLRSELFGKNLRVRSPYAETAAGIAYAVDWIGGAALLARRAAIEQAGLLDEHYFMYSEETDWCYRIKQCGWEICYLPTASVVHFGGQSSRQASLRMKTELYRSKLRFFGQHYGAARRNLLLLLLHGSIAGKAGLETMRLRFRHADNPASPWAEAMTLLAALRAPAASNPSTSGQTAALS